MDEEDPPLPGPDDRGPADRNVRARSAACFSAAVLLTTVSARRYYARIARRTSRYSALLSPIKLHMVAESVSRRSRIGAIRSLILLHVDYGLTIPGSLR